jgi:hypothetical protein
LTIDTGVAGNRVVHERMKPMAAPQSFSGLSARERSRLFREKLSFLPQMLEHHRWLTSYWVGGGKMEFINIQLDQNGTPMPYADIGTQLVGGVRTGRDVLIALTYGIKAVGLGRVCAAGLGAGGYAGMRRAFEIVCAELTRSMQLLGISSVRELRKRGAEIRRTNMLVGDAYLPKFVF